MADVRIFGGKALEVDNFVKIICMLQPLTGLLRKFNCYKGTSIVFIYKHNTTDKLYRISI